MTKEEKNKILQEMHNCILNKKPWGGLNRSKAEMNKSLDHYRGWLEKEVKVNMPWEDYFEFSDFATRMIRLEVEPSPSAWTSKTKGFYPVLSFSRFFSLFYPLRLTEFTFQPLFLLCDCLFKNSYAAFKSV